ncbi:MAG TPA: hypothetical protein VLO09_07935 [Ornithinimicrobium sp.]|nr:hypothetical protein [Ornithinimicrobium sp.]
MGAFEMFTRGNDGSEEPSTPVPPPVRPSVGEQLGTLARLGLETQDGVSAQDVADDRDAAGWVKLHPYVAVLQVMARGEDGSLTRHPRVTTVDLDHLVGPESYPELVRKLADAAGTTHLLSEVEGGVDEERGRWLVRFTFDDVTREIHPRRDHDRADPVVMPELFSAVAGAGQRPAYVRHGRSMTVAYVPARHAGELQRVFSRWA